MTAMTVILNHVLQWGILGSDGTGNYLLWVENPAGISVQLYILSDSVQICGAGRSQNFIFRCSSIFFLYIYSTSHPP